MKKIFLESHNIKNPYFGFGQFNYHLLKALGRIKQNDFDFTIHGGNIAGIKKDFGDKFSYKNYYSFRRYSIASIRKRYDLWHSMNQNTKFEPYHNIPYLLTVHNITFITDKKNYREQGVHKRFQEKLNRSNAITYISNYAKTSTHEFFNVPNVPEFVIYNGNPIKDTSVPDNFQPSRISVKPFLFSIGEFTERKNFKSLIPLLNLLPDKNLILAGKNTTSNAAEIRNLIAEHRLTERVFLVGKISDVEKNYYYQNCESFVFPSLREGFGLPIIEAMRFGKPIFTSNNTSLPEIGSDLVFYWNNFDEQYMAEMYKKGMAVFEKHRSFYTEKLIDRAKSFDWEIAAKSYLEVYKHLLLK